MRIDDKNIDIERGTPSTAKSGKKKRRGKAESRREKGRKKRDEDDRNV